MNSKQSSGLTMRSTEKTQQKYSKQMRVSYLNFILDSKDYLPQNLWFDEIRLIWARFSKVPKSFRTEQNLKPYDYISVSLSTYSYM